MKINKKELIRIRKDESIDKSKEGETRSKKGSGRGRELVLRALTDPAFRRQLTEDPEEALGIKRITETHKSEIESILATVKSIEYQIRSVGMLWLCLDPTRSSGDVEV